MSPTSYRLFVRKGPKEGSQIELSKEVTLIGRDVSNEVIMADPEVSRRHAQLTETDSGYVLEDLGSTNGTFVNQEKLTGPRILIPGDEIALGNQVALVFEEVERGKSKAVAESKDAEAKAGDSAAKPRGLLPAKAGEEKEPAAPVEQSRIRAWMYAGLGCLFVVVAIGVLILYLDHAHPDKLYGPIIRLLGLLGLK